MVRFHWHVEAGHSSFVPPGGVQLDKETGVRHVMCEMELAGQNETCTSMMTVPPDYLDAGNTMPVGIVLGHGMEADDWRGEFLTRIAVHFAKKGYVVMRYYCKQKEQRRQRIYEKALDTVATSPFARAVKTWVLAGFDNGARIAAQVGSKCRGNISGFILLSYPLLDPCPPPPKQKVGATPPADSKGPLLKLAKPMLFVNGEFDAMCPGADLRDVARAMADVDMRAVALPDLDGGFLTATERESVGEPAIEAILQHMQTFLSALETPGGLAACPLPRAANIVPTDRQPPTPMRKAAQAQRAAAEAAVAAAAAAAAEAAAAAAAAALPPMPAAPVAPMPRLAAAAVPGVQRQQHRGQPAAPPPAAPPPAAAAQRPVVPPGFPGLLALPPAGLQIPPGLVNNPAAIQQLQILMMQQQMLLMQQQAARNATVTQAAPAATRPVVAQQAAAAVLQAAAAPHLQQQQQQQAELQMQHPVAMAPAAQPGPMDLDMQPALLQ